MSLDHTLQQLGRFGFKICPAGQTINGDFGFLFPDGTATFSAVFEGSVHADVDDLPEKARDYGVSGHFTSVANASGDDVLCYHRVEPN